MEDFQELAEVSVSSDGWNESTASCEPVEMDESPSAAPAGRPY